jgi:CDP-4-dehydro-6-deoxyglucose reductase
MPWQMRRAAGDLSAERGDDVSHRVIIQPTGHQFDVPAQDTILKSGLAAGLSLPYGCRMGTCTTCRARIVEGQVDLGRAHPSYLTQADRAQGFALLCQAHALSDLTIEVDELPRVPPPQQFPAIIRKISRVAADVITLDLRLPLHLNLRFAAGQYVDILLPGGMRRSYSIANAPQAQGVIDLQFHIRHMPGGIFTDHLFSRLREREKLNCEGPHGTFFLRDSSVKPIVLVASGTGYAPIRSLVLDALSRKIKRPMTLFWGGRSARDLYLLAEPAQWAAENENFAFIPVLSEALDADQWTGESGFVHRAVMQRFPDLSGYQVYACGAPVMVDAARRDFAAECGHPATEFFADSFVTQADATAERECAPLIPA